VACIHTYMHACTEYYTHTYTHAHIHVQFSPLKHTLLIPFDQDSCIAMSRDSKLIANISLKKSTKIWDAETGKLMHTLKNLTSLSLSHDSTLLVRAGQSDHYHDTRICLWDFSPIECLKSPCALQTEVLQRPGLSMFAYYSAKFSPDGQMVARRRDYRHQTLSIWSVQTGEELVELTRINQGLNSLNPIAWSADSKTIATVTGSTSGSIIIFDACSGKELVDIPVYTAVHQAKQVNHSVDWIAFDSKKSFLLSASARCNTANTHIMIWDLHDNMTKATFRCRLQGAGYAFALSADDRYIASAVDFSIHIWDVSARRKVRVMEGHMHGVNNIVWSSDGRYIVSGSKDGSMRVWSANEQVVCVLLCVCVCMYVCMYVDMLYCEGEQGW
jgi:WD40 repeat protein